MQPTMTDRKKRVAVVIGAGAVKCAAALGMWKVLMREGIEIDMVVGCSGGSIYAAVMSLDYDLGECERLTQELWTPAITRRRDFRSMLGAAFPRLFRFPGHFGMVHGDPMLEALELPFGGRTFEGARVPLHIVATDLATGERVVLNEGSIRDAVRASIAIPYVWQPWRIGDRWLLDGCLSDPLPVDVAMREGADIILAMGFESPFPRRIRSATRYAFQINSIYTNNLLRANYAFHNLAHHTEIITVLPDFDRPVGLFDTAQFPYVIEQGERATEAHIDYLHRTIEQTHV
jgi:NTE family protein